MQYFILIIGSLLFSTGETVCMEVEKVSYEEELCVVVTDQHRKLDPGTVATLRLVSKKIRKTVNDAEDVYFSVKDTETNASGFLELVCSECFKQECEHSNKRKYRGMLRYLRAGGVEYRAYIASPHINHLVNKYNDIAPFTHIIASALRAHLPDFISPMFDTCTYHASVPYFDGGNLCVLTGIPISYENNIGKGCQRIITLQNVCEYMLSADNKYIERKAYFEFQEKKYPLGTLTLISSLYQSYLEQIRTKQCTITRNDKQTVFCNVDFFGKYLQEEGMANIVSTMLTMFCGIYCISTEQNAFCKHPALIKKFGEQTVNSSTDFVKMAVCSKLLGGNMLAEIFLEVYDRVVRKQLQGTWRPVYLRPFGGIDGIYEGNRLGDPRSDYTIVAEQLTTLSAIDSMLETIENKKRLLLMDSRSFIEIQKNESQHTIYPWSFNGTPSDYSDLKNWNRGEPYLLENCQGKIVEVDLGSKFNIEPDSKQPDQITLFILEKRMHCGVIVDNKYSICANRIPSDVSKTKSEHPY